MELIGDAFETAYTRYAEEQPVAPPDLAMPIFTGISMALLCVLFILTGLEYPDEKSRGSYWRSYAWRSAYIPR